MSAWRFSRLHRRADFRPSQNEGDLMLTEGPPEHV